MIVYPHKEKLLAAIQNRKAAADIELLQEAYRAYEQWKAAMQSLTETGEAKVRRLVEMLNQYKDYLEVELIARQGSDFLKRQKGQMKLDNSVIEEFYLIWLTIEYCEIFQQVLNWKQVHRQVSCRSHSVPQAYRN